VDARGERCRNFGIGCGAEAGIDGSEEGLFSGEGGAARFARREMLLQRERERFTACYSLL